MKAQRLSYRDALEFLARRTGVDSPRADGSARSGDLHVAPRHVQRVGLDAWVEHASNLLWQPYGERTRRWLTHDRGLPEEVVRLHRVGVTGITPQDSLPVEVPVEGPRSATPAAVLPISSRGRAVHAQLRLLEPDTNGRSYINLRHGTGRHPRLGLYRPPRRLHPEILITEGIIDALSANAAGYRAAALLGPGLVDAEVAVHLSRLNGRLVIAFDPDRAGHLGSDSLSKHLWAVGRRPALLAELGQDLNDSLVTASDWPRKLASHVRNAVANGPTDRVPEL